MISNNIILEFLEKEENIEGIYTNNIDHENFKIKYKFSNNKNNYIYIKKFVKIFNDYYIKPFEDNKMDITKSLKCEITYDNNSFTISYNHQYFNSINEKILNKINQDILSFLMQIDCFHKDSEYFSENFVKKIYDLKTFQEFKENKNNIFIQNKSEENENLKNSRKNKSIIPDEKIKLTISSCEWAYEESMIDSGGFIPVIQITNLKEEYVNTVYNTFIDIINKIEKDLEINYINKKDFEYFLIDKNIEHININILKNNSKGLNQAINSYLLGKKFIEELIKIPYFVVYDKYIQDVKNSFEILTRPNTTLSKLQKEEFLYQMDWEEMIYFSDLEPLNEKTLKYIDKQWFEILNIQTKSMKKYSTESIKEELEEKYNIFLLTRLKKYKDENKNILREFSAKNLKNIIIKTNSKDTIILSIFINLNDES